MGGIPPVTLSRQVSVLAGLLILLLSLGCGSSNNNNFEASVSPTANPMVAEYDLLIPPSGAVAWVEFGPDQNYGRQTSMTVATTARGQLVKILVAGMKASTAYHMRAHVTWPGQSWTDADQVFQTGAIPAPPTGLSTPGIKVTRPTPNVAPAGGVELFNMVGAPTLLRAFVSDMQGNVIWYYNPGPTAGDPTPMRMMTNGHFIMNVGDIREIDLAGNIYRDVTVAEVNRQLIAKAYDFTIIDFHHDLIVLPNGHWIALANVTKNFTDLIGYPGVTTLLGDALIDIDLNGNVAWAWNGFDHGLDVNRHLQTQSLVPGTLDWTHSNALIFTPDGNLLVSMRDQSWILKIDYSNGNGSGDIIWRLGWEGDFAIAGGDVSEWFYAQHFPHLESTDGFKMTFDIFDNGNLRVAPDGSMCAATCYSRATVFDVDEAARVATLRWDFLPGFYSTWGGSIGTLSNGDIEFDMSAPLGPVTPASQVMEVTPDGKQVVWQLNITGENAYRGYRIPSLYPGVSWTQ
jgi:arylsulfate sulfotransferase